MTSNNKRSFKRNLFYGIGLGAMTLFFTSSKEESQATIYADEISNLSSQELMGGGKINADSLLGKMLILNFWASYDPTSRINSYNLLKLNEQYANNKFVGGDGLNVVCVSLDVFQSSANKAIQADGTDNFFHICDLKGVESPLAKNFDVNRPVNLLINADGQIVARDFGTQTIEQTLNLLAQ